MRCQPQEYTGLFFPEIRFWTPKACLTLDVRNSYLRTDDTPDATFFMMNFQHGLGSSACFQSFKSFSTGSLLFSWEVTCMSTSRPCSHTTTLSPNIITHGWWWCEPLGASRSYSLHLWTTRRGVLQIGYTACINRPPSTKLSFIDSLTPIYKSSEGINPKMPRKFWKIPKMPRRFS